MTLEILPPPARPALPAVKWLHPRVRAWPRNRPPPQHSPATIPPPKPPAEFTIPATAADSRAQALQVLLDNAWTAGGATDCWDVEKHGTRVLLATEHDARAGTRTLVRVWGNRAELPVHWHQAKDLTAP